MTNNITASIDRALKIISQTGASSAELSAAADEMRGRRASWMKPKPLLRRVAQAL